MCMCFKRISKTDVVQAANAMGLIEKTLRSWQSDAATAYGAASGTEAKDLAQRPLCPLAMVEGMQLQSQVAETSCKT